jgi:dolichyl-phosphate-mannose--protein O-mannosyl transferase
MFFSQLLLMAFLLSAPIGGYSPIPLVGVLLVLVAVAVVSWRSGLRLVRKRQEKIMVWAGAVVLIIALTSSLQALELFVVLAGDFLR